MILRMVMLLSLCALSAPAELRKDITFAKHADEPLTLDAWVPDGTGPFPGVIVVHGGGFVRGDKQTYVPPLFPPLTEGGFAWFTINYRLAPKHRHPAAIQDVEAAVAWVRKNAAQYKVDPNRLALVGESAGGHIVAFAGTRRLPGVKAVVPFYAPTDFAARAKAAGTVSEGVQALLGVTDVSDASLAKMRDASPVAHLHKGMPPYLLIHGTKDAQVPYEQSPAMCAAMKKAGASCELYTVEEAGHGVGGWEKDPKFQGYKTKMVEWLKEKLR